VTWKPYTLKENETLLTLAKRAGVAPQDLIRANSLKQNARPLPGTVLLAPMALDSPEPAIETTLARFTGSRVIEKETLGPVYHRVTKKDSLAKIAKRYGVTAGDLKSTNHLEGEPVVGQRLLIRPARTQTVVTDERGKRTILSSAEAASLPPGDPPAKKVAPTKAAEKKKSNPEKKKASPEKKKSSEQKKTPAKSPGNSESRASS
jgi:LysM repeat protein